MRPKKIVILTHNPVRDPITDDCLAVALRKHGHTVWRRNFLDNDRAMTTIIKPDIVILPELRCEYSVDYATQCRKWGIQVIVRPCEVGISEESIPTISEDYRRAIFGENWPANDAIDLFLAWGPKMRDLFCKYGKLDFEKVVAVGGLAFDQFFLPPPPEQVIRTEKKRILFATGFAYADRNPQYSVPEAKPDDPIHGEMVKTDLESRAKWFGFIKRFWAEFGNDWEIWVKIHPGERPDVYKAVLRDTVTICPNVGPVRALRHVDAVVHAGSTMAYEAHLLNMPAINLCNICQDVVVANISPWAEDFDEFSKRLGEIEIGKSNARLPIIEALERDYYGKSDGNASTLAAEAINALPDNHPNVPNEWPKPDGSMKYATPCILKDVEQWHCAGCNTNYYVQGPREMVKCPSCGIANVKILQPVS